jgi:hypothetical protein
MAIKHSHVAIGVVFNWLNYDDVASAVMIVSIGMGFHNPLKSSICEAGAIILRRYVAVQILASGFNSFSHVFGATSLTVRLGMLA